MITPPRSAVIHTFPGQSKNTESITLHIYAVWPVLELKAAAGNCEAGLGVTLTWSPIELLVFFLNFTLQLLYHQPEMQNVGQKILKLLIFNGNIVGNAVHRIINCPSHNILKRNIYLRPWDWSELCFPWANRFFVCFLLIIFSLIDYLIPVSVCISLC